MNITKERDDLRECIDYCCQYKPHVNYNEQLKQYRVLCIQCFNEVVDNDSTRAMIKWNKKIRKIKW